MSKKLFANSPLSPCKDCQDRLTGDKDCHKDCERYINWKISFEEDKKKLRKLKQIENFQDFLRNQRTPKHLKRHNKKRVIL